MNFSTAIIMMHTGKMIGVRGEYGVLTWYRLIDGKVYSDNSGEWEPVEMDYDLRDIGWKDILSNNWEARDIT